MDKYSRQGMEYLSALDVWCIFHTIPSTLLKLGSGHLVPFLVIVMLLGAMLNERF